MTASFSQSDLIAYKSNLLQSLEELKYKRTECQDLNKRTEKLLAEKLQAQQSLEDLQTKLKNAEQKRDNLDEELRLVSMTVADSKHKEENHQLREAMGTAEKTVASLKKELSSMSLARHQLETRLKQAEQKVAARETSSNAVIERLRGIEAATEKLSKQLQESYEVQKLLERNVEASKAMNRELTRAWTHRNCLLTECRQQRDELRERLLDQECRYHAQEVTGESDQERILKAKNEILEQKISELDRQKETNTKLVEDLRGRLKEAQSTITKAHKIIAKCTGDDKDVVDFEKRLEKSEKRGKDWERQHSEVAAKLEMREIENDKKIAEMTSVLAEKENTMSKEIKLLQLQLDEAQKSGTDLKLQVENFKEVKLNLHELQARFDSLVNEKRSLLLEISRKDDQNEELRNKIDNVEIMLEDLKGRKPPECVEQESQTGIEVASERAGGNTPSKAFQSQKAPSFSESPRRSLQEGSGMSTDHPLEQGDQSRDADVEEYVEGTPDEDDAKNVEVENIVVPALTSPRPSAWGKSDAPSRDRFGSPPGRNPVKHCKTKSFEVPYMKRNESTEQGMSILMPRDSQIKDPGEAEEESVYEREDASSEVALHNKERDYLIPHHMTDIAASKSPGKDSSRSRMYERKDSSKEVTHHNKEEDSLIPHHMKDIPASKSPSRDSSRSRMYERKDSSSDVALHNKERDSLIPYHMTDIPASKSPSGREFTPFVENPKNLGGSQILGNTRKSILLSPVSPESPSGSRRMRKFSPFVKNPKNSGGSSILGNNARKSGILSPVSPENPSGSPSRSGVSGSRRNVNKKRKLSSTPPMLDASQCSLMDGGPSSDLIRKEVPLRVPKNFTKQVLSSKPHPKQQPNRYKPLDVITSASTSSPAIGLRSVNRPYTNLNFSKAFGLVFGGKRQADSPRTAETRGASDRFGNTSFDFRAPDRIFASDEELPGSDDSM